MPKEKSGIRKSPKGEATRHRILSKSALLFSEHGYNGVGMEQIATASDLSKPALYAHFKNKRQLYVDCIVQTHEEAFRNFVPPAKEMSPEQRLEHYLSFMLPLFNSNRAFSRLALHIVLDRDDVMSDLKNASPAFGQVMSFFSKTLEDLRPKHDPKVLLLFTFAITLLNEELLEWLKLNKDMFPASWKNRRWEDSKTVLASMIKLM
jgi:AcrR family transcriptional regulator